MHKIKFVSICFWEYHIPFFVEFRRVALWKVLQNFFFLVTAIIFNVVYQIEIDKKNVHVYMIFIIELSYGKEVIQGLDGCRTANYGY